MDGNEKVGLQIVSARRTLEQAGRLDPPVTNRTALSNPASRSDCAITSASFKLNSYSGTPRALSAPGELGRVAHINEHPKFGSRAPTAVAAVLGGRVLGAHRLPSCTGKHHGQRDNSKKGDLVDGHGSKLCDAAVSRPTRRFMETPRTLCTCFLAVVQQICLGPMSGQQNDAMFATTEENR